MKRPACLRLALARFTFVILAYLRPTPCPPSAGDPAMPRRCLSLVVVVALASWSSAAEPLFKSGDFVAVIGDSITEQKLYSLYIADYLLMCQPEANLRTTQFGWGGETAAGFERRMEN